jgi:hypothetical protein
LKYCTKLLGQPVYVILSLVPACFNTDTVWCCKSSDMWSYRKDCDFSKGRLLAHILIKNGRMGVINTDNHPTWNIQNILAFNLNGRFASSSINVECYGQHIWQASWIVGQVLWNSLWMFNLLYPTTWLLGDLSPPLTHMRTHAHTHPVQRGICMLLIQSMSHLVLIKLHGWINQTILSHLIDFNFKPKFMGWVLPQLRWLVADFIPHMSGFECRSGHVGFMVNEVALGQVFSKYISFHCQLSLHQMLHICHWDLV